MPPSRRALHILRVCHRAWTVRQDYARPLKRAPPPTTPPPLPSRPPLRPLLPSRTFPCLPPIVSAAPCLPSTLTTPRAARRRALPRTCTPYRLPRRLFYRHTRAWKWTISAASPAHTPACAWPPHRMPLYLPEHFPTTAYCRVCATMVRLHSAFAGGIPPRLPANRRAQAPAAPIHPHAHAPARAAPPPPRTTYSPDSHTHTAHPAPIHRCG